MAAMGAAAAAREASVNPRATSASIFAKEDKFGAHNYKPVSYSLELRIKPLFLPAAAGLHVAIFWLLISELCQKWPKQLYK